MKKLLLSLLIATTLSVNTNVNAQTYSAPATTPYVGGTAGIAQGKNGDVLIINPTQNNLSDPLSDWMMKLKNNGCPYLQTAVVVANINTTTSTNACVYNWVKNPQNINLDTAYGNFISAATSENCAFVIPNSPQGIFTAIELFHYTGGNKANAQINGCTLDPGGSGWATVWSYAGAELNNTAFTYVARINFLSGAVIPLPSLTPLLTGAFVGGTAKIEDVSIASGKRIYTGYMNELPGSVPAHKGFVEDIATGVIVDLNVDNVVGPRTTTVSPLLPNGKVLIGNTNTIPAPSTSTGFFLYDAVNNIKSAAVGAPINVKTFWYDVATNTVLLGGARLSPVGGQLYVYDVASNTTTNWSGNLFITPGNASVITGIVPAPGCPGCYIVSTNASADPIFVNTARASAQTDLAKVCPSGPLPVKLTAFSGHKVGSDNVIYWTTASEANSKGFEIERSSDGSTYTTVGFVSSKAAGGMSASDINYSFTDPNVPKGTLQYRLNQINFDNRGTWSGIIVIKDKVVQLVVDKVYPNPITTTLHVVVSSPQSQKLTVVVTDVSGKVLINSIQSVQKGSNAFELNFSHLSLGVYILRVADLVPQKVIKQ